LAPHQVATHTTKPPVGWQARRTGFTDWNAAGRIEQPERPAYTIADDESFVYQRTHSLDGLLKKPDLQIDRGILDQVARRANNKPDSLGLDFNLSLRSNSACRCL